MHQTEDRELRQSVRRLEQLIREVDGFPDPRARDRTREIVQALLELHGAGLARVLEHAAAAGDAGLAVIDALGQDEVVSSLLLLYGLHPLDLETRVRQALDRVRPSLHAHGADVDLLGIDEGVVRLRVRGSHGCPSSALTLESA